MVIDNPIRTAFIDAQRAAYEGLLRDIIKYHYISISDIKFAITIELASLEKLEKINNE